MSAAVKSRTTQWLACLSGVCLLSPILAAGAPLAPLRARNLTPYTALLTAPQWDSVTAAPDGWQLRVDTQIASHLSASSGPRESVILDGETLRSTVGLRRKVGTNWLLGIDIPYIRHSGGFLDQFVDGWHDLFGLPEGGRDLRARDLLQFEYRQSGVVANALTDARAGLGDITLTVGRALNGAGLEVHAGLKLPSGDAARLTGSGGTDVSLALFQPRATAGSGRWQGYYWGAGVIRLGAGDLEQPMAEDWLLVGLLGSAYAVTPRVHLKAQLQMNSAPYKSNLEELGSAAVQLSFGATIEVGPDAALDLLVSEDLMTNRSPDVAFGVGLSWNW